MTSSGTQLTPTVTQQPPPPPTQSNGWWGRDIIIGMWEIGKIWLKLLFILYFESSVFIHIYIFTLSAHFKNLFLDTGWIPGTREKFYLYFLLIKFYEAKSLILEYPQTKFLLIIVVDCHQ